MKKFNLSLIFLVVVSVLTNAQKCKVYLPTQIGTEVELTQYDKKDKPTSIIKQTFTEKKNSGDTTIFKIHQVVTDEKGKEPMENYLSFKCLGEVFYIDMNSFVDQKQMESYKDMDVKMTTSEINMPATLTTGQTLNDGFVLMEILMGAMTITNRIDIVNRKVEGFESITTPAGTFECVKLSQDTKMQMGFVKVNVHSIVWYAENVGSVRSENYSGESLSSYMQITKITKP